VAWRVTWLAIVATAVTGVIGMTFKTWFESTFADRDLLWVGFMVTGVALAVTPLLRRGRRGWRQVGWHHAAWIGLAQAISILPSISRSGATICAALFCGIRRRWAAEFSFLIAVPAILGATLIKLKDSFEVMGEGVALPWGAILFGSVVAGVVGLFALLALLHILRLSKLHYFAPYCWVIGALILLRVL
jgi:undecaprenyl-diphosphatase